MDGHEEECRHCWHWRSRSEQLDRIEQKLDRILNEEGTIMTDVATVAADFDQYKTDVAAAFARLQASIDAGNTDAQALADLDAAINGADADANNEDAAPIVTDPAVPVDGAPVDGSTAV